MARYGPPIARVSDPLSDVLRADTASHDAIPVLEQSKLAGSLADSRTNYGTVAEATFE